MVTQTCREHDLHLMSFFQAQKLNNGDMALLNMCRLYLKGHHTLRHHVCTWDLHTTRSKEWNTHTRADQQSRLAKPRKATYTLLDALELTLIKIGKQRKIGTTPGQIDRPITTEMGSLARSTA